MDYILFLNKSSKDDRVKSLSRLARERGIKIADINSDKEKADKAKGILFIEPRAPLPINADKYVYVFGYSKSDAPNYVTLSDDEFFIQENNYLTALAMKEIILKKFGTAKKKILIVGYGKLCTQLERVFTDADIHILNFNHHKVQELTAKYGHKAYFENTDFKGFPIVINTIPKPLLDADDFDKNTIIYELASPPYGLKGDTSSFQYEVLPGLPGKYYPDEAANLVLNTILRYLENKNAKPTIVLCVTGSSCSYLKLMPILSELAGEYNVIPVLSPNANLPNRFGDIEKFRTDIIKVCGNPLITTIAGAETLSSNKKIVASVVLPATGNTLAKLAHAVTDTCVTMAVKALLRNEKPCILGISTNDALSGSAPNIAALLNRKNYYFIPFSQDDPVNKPFSLVCDFSRTSETIKTALKGKQLQPVIFH